MFLRMPFMLSIAGLIAAGVVSGQVQSPPPATLDDLLMELRGIRAEISQSSSASMRAQIFSARLALQEARISALAQQLASVRQQLVANQLALAPFEEQMKQAAETNSQILAPLRNTLELAQRRDRELRQQEAELARLIASEERRWLDFDARLDELERSSAGAR
jgi:hypothetical protein